MNNLQITICVVAIAVAQLLTILLTTIGRERDIRKLRKLVSELREIVGEQRLRTVELGAWLAGRNAAQPIEIKSESEPIPKLIANNSEAPEPAITPEDLPETTQASTTEDKPAQSGQADSGVSSPSGQMQWPIEDLRRHVARLKQGDIIQPSTTEDELERVKEDDDKVQKIG
jgi:hypothetical protein